MKVYNYFTIGISLIFLVMGILFLSGAFNTAELFRNNELFRYLFGVILAVYGIFRAHNAYLKLKQGPRNFRYYDPPDEE